MDKLTFGELKVDTPFVKADGCTWRKCKPKPNPLLPNAPANNAMTMYRRNPAGDAYYGHFDAKFSEFLLATAYFREVAA